jgi:hypothetical protein
VTGILVELAQRGRIQAVQYISQFRVAIEAGSEMWAVGLTQCPELSVAVLPADLTVAIAVPIVQSELFHVFVSDRGCW